jgi:predicted transcriptional regulator
LDVRFCSLINVNKFLGSFICSHKGETQMNPRRTKMQIYIDILKNLQKSNGRMIKTHIVYKANLTHKRLKEYLNFLILKEFIEERNNGGETFFVITEKGIKFLKDIDKLKKISDAFGVPL